MLARIRRYFISGLVIFLPVVLSVYLLVFAINVADGFLGKFIKPYFIKEFGFYYRGIGLVACMVVIFFIGFLATNFLGRKLYTIFESLLLKLPFFKQVYPAIKEISAFLFSREGPKFRQVVLVEYPRKGLYSLGFLTNDASKRISDKVRGELSNVFIPSAPGPLTGYVIMVPKREIVFLDLSVEEAVKLIVSGGVVNPVPNGTTI